MKTLGILSGLAAALVMAWLYWAGHVVAVSEWWLAAETAENVSKAGTWGDSFGAFNALVSTLGSAAILATLWLQSKSLKDQARDLHKQRFESHFFELLILAREVRGEIIFTHSEDYNEANRPQYLSIKYSPATRKSEDEVVKRGHEAIRMAVTEFRYWITPGRMPTKSNIMLKAYEQKIHKHNEASLGPYFRLIYTILKRIKSDNVLSEQEKCQYGNLLRSQLTSEELIILAVNGMAPFSNDMAELIRYFRLLKYLPESSVRRRLVPFYGSQAFAARD